MKTITIKGIKFKYRDSYEANLKKHDLVTPIWRDGRYVRLLVTTKETGENFYIESSAKNIYISVQVITHRLPQGITYELKEDALLTTTIIMISIIPD